MPNASKPQLAMIFVNAAEMLSSNGLTTEGISYYERAQSLIGPASDPNFEASILTGTAQAYMSMHDFDKAKADLGQSKDGWLKSFQIGRQEPPYLRVRVNSSTGLLSVERNRQNPGRRLSSP